MSCCSARLSRRTASIVSTAQCSEKVHAHTPISAMTTPQYALLCCESIATHGVCHRHRSMQRQSACAAAERQICAPYNSCATCYFSSPPSSYVNPQPQLVTLAPWLDPALLHPRQSRWKSLRKDRNHGFFIIYLSLHTCLVCNAVHHRHLLKTHALLSR